MATTDQVWEKRCKIWGNSDGSIYSNSVTAPAPSKNFLQVYVSPVNVILRIWKILPPTRADSNQVPSQQVCTYSEFHDDEKMRGEIERNMGTKELDYVDRLVLKHIDYLNRLPRKVLLKIAFLLDLVSIARLGQVNKLFRELCSCDALWSKIYFDHTKKQASQELLMLVDQKGWKDVFFMNKLQLQMQMRRTAKESRSFFLTSHRQHSSEDEETSHAHHHRDGQQSPSDIHERLKSDDEQSYQAQHGEYHQDKFEEQGRYHYDYEDQRQSQDAHQYQDDVPEYAANENDDPDDYQYQDRELEMQYRYQAQENSPDFISYQE